MDLLPGPKKAHDSLSKEPPSMGMSCLKILVPKLWNAAGIPQLLLIKVLTHREITKIQIPQDCLEKLDN